MEYQRNEVALPTLEEIATMGQPRLDIERTKLKNEISFIRGDAARDGLARQDKIDAYNKIINAIEERKKVLKGGGAT